MVIQMDNNRISKNLKFKINGLSFTVIPEKPLAITDGETHPVKNLHYHTMYELVFVEDNPTTVYTSSTSVEFKNCLLCIPPFCKHKIERKSGLRILFSYDKTQSKSTLFSQFADSFFSHTEPFVISCDYKMKFLFSELDNSFETAKHLSDEIAESVIKLIFCNIFNSHSSFEKTNITTSGENYLIKIDDIINDFQSDVTLQSLANALHLSTKQTTRILQKNYKKKLSEIMTEKRLSVAAELLLRTDKTISEIVEYVNFPSERYFYSKFKKTFGCTPKTYQKNQY